MFRGAQDGGRLERAEDQGQKQAVKGNSGTKRCHSLDYIFKCSFHLQKKRRFIQVFYHQFFGSKEFFSHFLDDRRTWSVGQNRRPLGGDETRMAWSRRKVSLWPFRKTAPAQSLAFAWYFYVKAKRRRKRLPQKANSKLRRVFRKAKSCRSPRISKELEA